VYSMPRCFNSNPPPARAGPPRSWDFSTSAKPSTARCVKAGLLIVAHIAAVHARTIALNPARFEFDALGTGTHMGILAWLEVWLIANALLLVWRVLVTTDEMTTRVGSSAGIN
jgi:hypothetical protein